MDFLSEVEKKLDLPPGEKAQVIRELKSHYEELKGELVASGMDADLAARETSRRLGDPADVAFRLQAIHCRATWKTALLAAFPFVTGILATLLHIPVARALPASPAFLSAVHSYLAHLLILSVLFAAILLTGSIRELMRNRRPVWLATWLVVGINELIATVYLLEQLIRKQLPANQENIVPSLIFILVFGIAAMATFRRSTKWFLILGGWTILAEAMYVMHPALVHTGWFYPLLLLVPAPLVMALALRVFARHPYGNTAQASLFLFAFYVGLRSHPVVPGRWIVTLALDLLPALVIIVTALAYARSITWHRKLVVLFSGIVAVSLAGEATVISLIPQTWLHHVASYMTRATIQMLFMLFWVILVPLLFERRWSDRRPEFVR
ncbi:MAG TPA: hypothetical protein VFI02_01940 [Armatimonadota bacterium]|nr:hypothetical protein [Armatimonadota bacterium]